MPGKHEPGHRPKASGPKERELAVALTVAVLGASKPTASLAELETIALDVYGRILAGITKPERAPPVE